MILQSKITVLTLAAGLAFATPTLSMELLPSAKILNQEQAVDFSSMETMQKSILDMGKGKTEAQRGELSMAFLRILISRNPLTKDQTGLGYLTALASLGEALYVNVGGAYDGITLKVLEAEVAAFKTKSGDTVVGKKALACLQSKLVVGNPRFGKDKNWGKFELTNNLGWTISSYNYHYTIFAEGRSVPLDEGGGWMSISGGIEPNETKTLGPWFGANFDLARAGHVKIEISILNVLDAKKRLVIAGRGVRGMAKELSPNKCE